ncbi:MAG: T9SS type A sorting domain-containing protein [Chlorobi bacterium]|nr:T9SS type A sorting domain-containing protein [Chlorobiota bacterium]
MDSDLNILASNDYSPNAFHSLCGILKSNDGGCLVYGSQHAPYEGNENDIYVLKIAQEDLITSTEDHYQMSDLSFHVNVFPNPTSGFLNFELDFNSVFPTEIVISDNIGNTVLTHKLFHKTKNISIDCRCLLSGSYVYSIMRNNKTLYTGKFIKK